MEYKLTGPKLQDLQTKQTRLLAKASDIGAVTATTITIPLSSITTPAITAASVLYVRNHTKATTPVATVVGANLVLTDAAVAATDVIDICIVLG